MSTLPTDFAPAERAPLEVLRRQAEELFSNKTVTGIIDSIPEMILILNPQRQAVFVNQTLMEKLNIKDEKEVIGKRPGEIFQCIHALESEHGCGTTEFCRYCGSMNAILNSQSSGEKDIQECRILQKDSLEALDFRVTASRLRINKEDFTIFSVLDISAEKRRRILEKVFFHDILNTAGNIRGLSQLMEAASEKDFTYYRKLLPLVSSKLIDEIESQRTLYSAENRELAVNLSALSSRDIIEETAALYKGHFVAMEKNIEIDPVSEDIDFICDSALLLRVLGNMTKNALESTPRDGVVRIGCRLVNDTLTFSVHNQGCMTKEVQSQIFKRSFSTKGKDRGVGTYSMKLIGERYLKGEVKFVSNEEEGTVFTFSLKIM